MADLQKKGWQELYQDALLESDSHRLLARLDRAESAIQLRLTTLSANSKETREWNDLNVALYFLGLLRIVGTNADAMLPMATLLRKGTSEFRDRRLTGPPSHRS
jgi:hypothetical protein